MSSFVATWFMGDYEDDYFSWYSLWYPMDIFRGLVRTTIGFFDDTILDDPAILRRAGSYRLKESRGPPSLIKRLIRRFLLGLPVVGAGSIAHMLWSIPMPFYHLRLRTRRIGRQSKDLMALIVLAVVIAGAASCRLEAIRTFPRNCDHIAHALLLFALKTDTPPPPDMASYHTLQQTIREEISRPDFDAALPPLSDQTWMRILSLTPQAHAENERLEFLGDALMYATIGRQLYAQVPNGSPHLYTLDIMAVSSTVLKALTRKTFGEGTAAPHKTRPQIKATADLFETVIGAYYLDHGFEALYEWVKEIYTPLIKVTVNVFNTAKSRPPPHSQHRDSRTFNTDRRPQPRRYAPPPIKQKLLLSPVQRRKRAIQKINAAHAARRSPSLKITTIGFAALPAKPILSPKSSLSKSAKEAAPLAKRTPIFIDLTLDSDSDSDNEPSYFRHPLVTPRIPRSSAAVSKQITPAPAASPAVDTGVESDSEWEDETMLEHMLTAEDAFSDMDCGESDVESPAGPSNLAPFLTRPGSIGSPLKIGTPPNVRTIRQIYG
ncbi:hypothetical protein BN946_scf184935.g8 [Trametes cinnabarina]|uniref:RNase III domain-containing protein n=1 Tax=Pycnoporus cinnabarinus TaxID=5643 RepID=A0A060SLS6_PYCCI|nr:hypothetical protein BN946_scf184935.g8 [Trametes cinnabarina]